MPRSNPGQTGIAEQSGPSPQPGVVGHPDGGYGNLTTPDHKLFPRPLKAIIDCGNVGPNLVGASGGWGSRLGPGSLGREPAPVYRSINLQQFDLDQEERISRLS